MSPPAKTVARWSGRVPLRSASAIPGRALPAAQPQTELTTIIVVPGAFDGIVHVGGGSQLFESDTGQLLAHRREEVFGISLGDHLVDHNPC